MAMGSDPHRPRHEELAELLGAYALDAVPEDERQMVEAHIGGCPRCRAEVEEHRATAATLAAVGAPAPAGLWDHIAEEIEASHPADLERARARRREGRRTRWGMGRWAAAAAATVVVVAIGGLGLKVVEQDRVLDRLVMTGDQRGLVQASNAALLDPRSSRVTLASEDEAVRVDAVLLPNGTGYLIRNNLRPLATGRTYQLWALDEGVPVSVGVIGRDPGVVPFSVDPRVAGLAITEERSGGVVSTKNDPLVVGDVDEI